MKVTLAMDTDDLTVGSLREFLEKAEALGVDQRTSLHLAEGKLVLESESLGGPAAAAPKATVTEDSTTHVEPGVVDAIRTVMQDPTLGRIAGSFLRGNGQQ